MRDLPLSPPPLPLSSPSPLQFRRAFETTATPALDRRMHASEAPRDIAAPALLYPVGPVTETWSVAGPLREQRRGVARFTSDGHWLMGTLCIDDATLPGGIGAA